MAQGTESLGDGRRNNFDALRVTAALMVIHGHGWVLAGGPGPGLWGVPFARVGLDVFFSISGYLVTGSWERTPALLDFLAKRALRIFPGLIACVLATVLVLGPLATRLPLAEYAASGGTYRYLANIALLNELFLPGVFEGLRERGAVNGSLWSLLPEFTCYLTVPILATLTQRRGPLVRPWLLAVLAAACGGVGLYLFEGYAGPPLRIYNLDLKYALVEAPFFLVGSALRLLDGRVRDLWRADLCLLFFLANYAVSAWLDWWNIPLEWFTLPYMVIAFGRMSLPVAREAGRFGDLSYGLYLYAFPVQQLVLAFMPGLAYPVLTCVLLTLPLAFLSWYLVERPALRWKRLRPRPQRWREPSSRRRSRPPLPDSALGASSNVADPVAARAGSRGPGQSA
jgi:peptidoglycan/LPS O-acetylase OafA/YrhL